MDLVVVATVLLRSSFHENAFIYMKGIDVRPNPELHFKPFGRARLMMRDGRGKHFSTWPNLKW